MKHILLILTISILTLFTACENGDKNAVKIDSEALITPEPEVLNKPFANPVFIYGSSFGNFFQMLYKQGKFEDMLKFTSSNTITKFGKENIVVMYQNMAFAYEMKLKSQTISGDTTILNYEAGIFATKHMIRIPVIIENDTAKIVINKLDWFK